MKTKSSRFVSILLGLSLLNTAAFADTLFSISSAVTSGAGQNVFAGAAQAGTVGGGDFAGSSTAQLVFNNGGASDVSANDFFVAKLSGHAQLINVGDKLTLNFSVTATNIATISQAFRFGLFNSGVATSDNFVGTTGYLASYGNTNSNNGLYERTSATSPNLWVSTAVTRFSDVTAPSGSFSYVPGATAFTGSLTLELLSGNQVKITSQIGSTTSAWATDATGVTSFDAIAFYFSKSTAGDSSLTFSNLTLAYTSAIPEPSSWALIGGAATLLLIAISRCMRNLSKNH